jgi:Cdc6-like AAA superfamily ATPase
MLFLFDWIFWPIKLLLVRDFKRVMMIIVVWSLPVIAHQLFPQIIATIKISPLIFIASYYLYLYASSWCVYVTSLPSRWREACEHLKLKTALERFPTVVKIDSGFFCINARGFSLPDFEDRRAELSSYLRIYIREIKPNKRLGFIDIFFSKKDLPNAVAFNPTCAFGELVLGYGSRGYLKRKLPGLIHIGIAGLPGSGKSVMLRSLITQVLVNYPKSVIIGIDFKNGSEFHIFENVMNFVLCSNHESTAAALQEIFDEYKRRAEYIKGVNQDNAFQVVGPKGERISPIFVVIDEAFEFFVKDKSESYQQSVKFVNQLARLARFVGIHLIIATQRPDVDAIPPQIRSMLKTRICFRLRQKEDSIMFVGSSAATELRDVPGRFLLAADDGTFEELQAMWLSKEDAIRLITKAVTNRTPAKLFERMTRVEIQD